MLRILTLSTLFPNRAEPTLGGFVERQTLGLAARLGVAVEVVAPVGLPLWPLSRHAHYAARAKLPSEEIWKGLRVYRPRYTVWPKLERRTPGAMAEALLPCLRRIRERFAFDIIDAEFFWPDGPAAAALAEALGTPFSIKARGSDINYWGRRPDTLEQILSAARAADGLLAVSAALKQSMSDLGLPGEKVGVHYTGVDLEQFRPLDRAKAKKDLGVEGPLIVTAGALIPGKGQALAIEALADVPGATLVLVGDGPDKARLKALAAPLGGRVRFAGRRPHQDLPFYLGAADVTLLPSASEGLANVWVESLACGTPVVTSDVGGARETIDRPEAGRMVARDPTAIAAALKAILADPPDQSAVRRAAADRFSWEKNAAELEAHLAGVARCRAAAAA
ncbi:MAG TPA: glycosyltransferase [Allosphingosinicella sp.]|jgi:glycosyltransferase involved in cell wall biosynthesis